MVTLIRCFLQMVPQIADVCQKGKRIILCSANKCVSFTYAVSMIKLGIKLTCNGSMVKPPISFFLCRYLMFR